MSTLYLTEQGSSLRKNGERLIITKGYGKEMETLDDVPLIKVDQVIVFGNVNITPYTIALLLENGVEVCYLSNYGKYRGRLIPEIHKNSLIRLKQYEMSKNYMKCMYASRAFTTGKLSNMRSLLMRYNRRLHDDEITEAIKRIKKNIESIKNTQKIDSMRGFEGAGSAEYFSAFKKLLKQDLGFDGRTRRPPTDPINSLLSFGYTLLTNDIFSVVNLVGLDPYIGLLHTEKHGKPSLVLDLVEEFRQVIVDAIVLKLINNYSLTMDDFKKDLDTYYLSESGKKVFLKEYETRKNTEIKHPLFGYKTTYKHCFELQVRLFSKYLIGEVDKYIPFIWR